MIHNLLKDKEIILASASPRRMEIFKLVGLTAIQMPSHIEEDMIYDNPIKLVKYHAKNKALAIKKQFENDHIVVGADTIVYHDNVILEKPVDIYQAADFLSRLSNSVHYVYTGIAIAYKNQIISDYAKSRVEFSPLSALEIEEYIKTREPLDKAGAYGIQGYGSQFIKKINGCYFNVMGFPVSLFYKMVKSIVSKDKGVANE
ncbi:MAG: septum formation protein Maf [Candidatus Cloacimonas sp. 4484_143]|nr:MAG: septum formation protein Maf [Candidatus Cloacimonas sp. 4484_143]RLC52162.1 MAG: septum formation protein Maf [Candidatus Cloacimonadota bacterium]RLC58777.1 MAG: septum formation protein Maf [Candidatus Cloacimonadota bacterium]